MLPRLKIIEEFYSLEKIDYFLFPNLNQRFQKESLDYLKIPNKKRLSSIKCRHIEANLIISTDHPYVIKNDRQMKYKIFLIDTKVVKKFFLNEKIMLDNKSPEKIYIDRSDAKSNHSEFRKIINEKEIIQKLIAEGYKTIRLADLSFVDQIKIFYNAKKLLVYMGLDLLI